MDDPSRLANFGSQCPLANGVLCTLLSVRCTGLTAEVRGVPGTELTFFAAYMGSSLYILGRSMAALEVWKISSVSFA